MELHIKFILLKFQKRIVIQTNIMYLPLVVCHQELPHINAHVQFLIWQRKTHHTVQLTIAKMDPTRTNTYQEGLDL